MTTEEHTTRNGPESPANRPAPLLPWLFLLVVPTVLGLIASAMLVVDYSHPVPLFCDDHGGCDAVRKTMFASLPFVHVPTPYLGLAAFVVFAILLFLKGARVRFVQWTLAVIGAVLAVLFITVQMRIGAFCKFCMVVDVSMLVLLAGSIRRKLFNWDAPSSSWLPVVTGIGASLAALGPLAVGFLGEPATRIPPVIEREIEKTPKGKVLVIDFADFECPHCRIVHQKLTRVLNHYEGRVTVVRKHVPLVKIHPHSEAAAKAAICAEVQGKGERMADLLFLSPVDRLTKEGCEKASHAAELNFDAYQACVESPLPNERIEADRATFKEAGGLGLPTIWIGRQDLRGSGFEEADYRAAVEKALIER